MLGLLPVQASCKEAHDGTCTRIHGFVARTLRHDDRAELRESDRPVLDRFASVVREHYPGAVVTVEGFADPAGSAAYNRRLGQRRGESVRQYLTSDGQLGAERIRVVSYGEARDRQVVPGAQGPNGLPNRRVALVIDYAGTAGTDVALP